MLKAFFYNLLKRAIQELLEGTLKDIQRETAESRAESQVALKDIRREATESRAEFQAALKDIRREITEARAEFRQEMAALTARIDRLSGRMDDLTREQARLAEIVAELKTERSVTADILHRLEKIEDKVYA